MKKEETIRNFVRTNYRLLVHREEFDRRRYKDIKNAYFGKQLQHRFGIPRDKEICNCLVDFLIKARGISDGETLGQVISDSSFLRMNNIKADDYVATIDLAVRKYAIKEETQELQAVEKQEKLLDWIKRERAKEVEELISKKKEEYRRLPSILDETDFDEPEELPKREEAREWWEELKLRENPFPGDLDGIFLIDKSLYDEIIIETPPIKWALDEIKKEQISIFHRAFLLGGEFGTGKTTFFDFISPRLTMRRIEPIRIAPSENISEAHYAQNFQNEMSMQVTKIANRYNLPGTPRITDFEETRLLMLEIQSSGIKGFLVFVDDLHKKSDSNRVFNFLANLQSTKNNFTRDGINVVFVVSGFPNWRDRIRRDSALTGFFDASDELTLPEVTPQLAAQAIEKRLQAFSVNPEKELAVREEFLQTVFKQVSAERGRTNIGFRPYIQEAVRYFEERKFDILSIDFTELDESATEGIKQVLEAHDDFKKSIDKLVFGGGIKKKEVREITLKVLCETYLRKGVSEDEDIFNDNKFSFKQLSKCGLIQKYDRKGKLVWGSSPFLEELNKKVIKEFSLSMEDYLVPIYSTRIQRTGGKKGKRNMVQGFKRDLKGWKGELELSILSNLNVALGMYSKYVFQIAETDTKKLRSLQGISSIDRIEECIWTMMKCVIRFESPRLFDLCGESNIHGWTLRHRTLEYCSHFIPMVGSLRKERTTEADIARLISFANDAFVELWNEFKQSVKIYRSSHVKCCKITKRVLKTTYSEGSIILSSIRPKREYFEFLDKLVGDIEESIRQYLLVSCSLIFGQYHVRVKYYPEDIRSYIVKKVPSSSISYESYNEFENLNRGQYRQLFTQIGKTSELYRFIIHPLIRNWDSQDISSFFDLFGGFNIITSHMKTTSVEDIKRDVPTFFRLACRLISAISDRLIFLVVFNSTILRSNSETSVVFGYNCEKHGKVMRIAETEEATDLPSSICHHDITEVCSTSSIGKIMDNSNNVFAGVELDLMDIEETRIKFGMTYCESIALITNLVANGEVRVIPLYGTSICLARIS